jgi:UDP-3-O-[3-hydroxymyristoyl] glucosamine N-acyltransferase
MKFSVKEIAQLLGAEVEGNEEVWVDHLAKIEEGEAGGVSFLANPKYEPYLYQTSVSAVLVARDFVPKQAVKPTLLRVDEPYAAFTHLLERVAEAQKLQPTGIEEPAFVAADAQLGADVYVGAFSYIGAGAVLGEGVKVFPQVYVGPGVSIGPGTVLFPQSTVYPGCEIGAHCIIHAGACIGSDGFGFAPQPDGSFRKIPQTGNVILEDEVEVGAQACIDRATLGHTVIRKGVKLDNLVQVAHNVEVGPSTVIAAQSGIAGSTKLGAGCMLGGQVGVVGHLHIAARSRIDAQSGVNRHIKEEGQSFRGSPIQPYRNQLKSEVMFRKLEEMARRIEQLEKALAQREVD